MLLAGHGYAVVFDEVVELGEKNEAFDPKTMGACPNVRLMAQEAEVHGPHPCTIEVKMTAAGDVYRSCQTKDAPIKDWVVWR